MSSADNRLVPSPDDEEAQQLLVDVYDHDLPPVLDDLVEDYQRFECARPSFMWKWVHKLAPQNTLPCVRAEYADAVPVDKTIAILFVTLLDDVLEKRRDRATFEAVAAIPYEHRSADPERDGVDADYVAFAERVWETLIERVQRGPEYETYAPLLRYDFGHAIDAIEYSDLVIRRPDLATMADSERHESHNMAMFAYADIDLMHSPPAVGEELAPLREAIWEAQQMARIGNWASTWERELREGDFSNGLLVYALENGIINRSELRAAETGEAGEPDAGKPDAGGVEEAGTTCDDLVERIRENEVEELFLKRWVDHYERLAAIDDELTTVDLAPFVEGTEEVLRYHLASTGLK